MDEGEPQQLPPLVQELARAADLVDGRAIYSDEAQARWVQRLGGLPPGQRQETARAIAALAARFSRLGQAAAEPAVDVLLGLCVLLLGKEAAAAQILAQEGLDQQHAARIGAVVDKQPVGSQAAPPGSVSPLGARLKR
jgi:hypothetical protein